MKFNVPLVKEWIVLLESGEFRQTGGRLKAHKAENHGAKHCCLGVLCELYSVKVGGFWEKYETGYEFHAFEDFEITPENYYNGDEDAGYTEFNDGKELPVPVAQWAGIGDEAQRKLAQMNDTGYSFMLIARYLRERLAEFRKTGEVTWPDASFDEKGELLTSC